MRAALLLDDTPRFQVVDVAVSSPIGREVVLRTAAVGLCHSDAHVLDGTLVRPRPMLLGHEAAGVVEAVGPDVQGLAVGDRVVTCLVMGCGSCARCDAGEPTGCLHPEQTKRTPGAAPRLTYQGGAVSQMANIGGLGEQILADERAMVRLPDDLPMDIAPLLGCAVVTGLGTMLNVARVRPGEGVAVIGCGGVGLNVIAGASIAGAGRVIAVDVNDTKLAMARRFGATDTVNSRDADSVAAVVAMTGGGVDHAVEVVGRADTLRQAFAMAAPGRAAYVVGIHADDAEIPVPASGLRRGKALVGVFMGSTRPRVDIPRYADLWRAGRLDLAGMVSHTFTLDEVNEGFAAMASGEAARAVVKLPG